jgi:hypothetical protein
MTRPGAAALPTPNPQLRGGQRHGRKVDEHAKPPGRRQWHDTCSGRSVALIMGLLKRLRQDGLDFLALDSLSASPDQ